MHDALIAIVLYIFAACGFGSSDDARAIAEADAYAVEAELTPASGESHAFDIALLAYYEAKESGVQTNPKPRSPDALAGQSCGMLQEPCYFVRNTTLAEQAQFWLESVRAAGLASVDSSRVRAQRRAAEARHLLALAIVGL